ncbi:MAG TPA: winged helix-turn-helix domain-containing protein [Terriglobales bacterium]|nr:winged helix-turn-helix domain-containing protein [Terriglobales bacterium]
MADKERQPGLQRFENFEVDLRSGELRKAGVKLKFAGQPFHVLSILLESPGHLVTREELQKRLWPDTFVDVEHNLNTSINKIREVLGDSAESPRYVETLPRRGYRFIAPVESNIAFSGDLAEEIPPTLSKTSRKPLYYGLTILGAAIISTSPIWKAAFQTPNPPQIHRFKKLTDDGRAKFGPMVTDGRRIYFTEQLPGPRNIVVQLSTDGSEVIPLPVPLKQPAVLDLSKKGTELLVANDEGHGVNSLWVQPIAGGSPSRLGEAFGYEGVFSADGSSVVYCQDHVIYSVNRDGSSPRKLLTTNSVPFSVRFSPDAKLFRFSEFNFLLDTMTVMEAAPDGTGLHKMFEGCCGEWTPDGRYFIFQGRRDGGLNFWASPAMRSSRCGRKMLSQSN